MLPLLPLLSQVITSSPFPLSSSSPVATSPHTWIITWAAFSPIIGMKEGSTYLKFKTHLLRVSELGIRISLKWFHLLPQPETMKAYPTSSYPLIFVIFTWGLTSDNLIECMIGMRIYKNLSILFTIVVVFKRPGNATSSQIIWFPILA